MHVHQQYGTPQAGQGVFTIFVNVKEENQSRIMLSLKVAGTIGLETTVQCPLIYYPLYYMCQEYVHNPQPKLSNAIRVSKENAWDDFKNLCMVWLPFYSVAFSIVPNHLRGGACACYGLVWAAFLSYNRGQYQTDSNIYEEACVIVQ